MAFHWSLAEEQVQSSLGCVLEEKMLVFGTFYCLSHLEAANLWMIETVDSVKLANALNQTLVRKAKKSVNVFVQVNTSGEDSNVLF